MDISETLAPKSDQMDACELAQPTTFTIVRVTKGGSDEQPVEVFLAEFPRPWRPGKSMRRVLAACWTPHATEWTGRRLTLFCDSSVRFGGIEVGGIRISHMSDLPGPKKVPLLVTRGKSAMYIVQPLREAPRTAPQSPAGDVNAAVLSAVDAHDDPDGAAEPLPSPDPSEPSAASGTPITSAQLRMTHALFTKCGITDRDLGLEFCREQIGREITSTKDLSKSEAGLVLDALTAMSEEAPDA